MKEKIRAALKLLNEMTVSGEGNAARVVGIALRMREVLAELEAAKPAEAQPEQAEVAGDGVGN